MAPPKVGHYSANHFRSSVRFEREENPHELDRSSTKEQKKNGRSKSICNFCDCFINQVNRVNRQESQLYFLDLLYIRPKRAMLRDTLACRFDFFRTDRNWCHLTWSMNAERKRERKRVLSTTNDVLTVKPSAYIYTRWPEPGMCLLSMHWK